MVCLETTFLVDVLRGEPKVKEIIASLRSKESLFIASPTVMELWSGALLAKIPQREKEKIDVLLDSLVTLSLDEKAAKEAAEIEVSLLKKGGMIDIEDIMIAAISVVNGEKLISRDQHYARIANLRLEKY